MMTDALKKALAFICERKINAIIRSNSINIFDLAGTAEEISRLVDAQYLHLSDPVHKSEDLINQSLKTCHKKGATMILGGAEHMSGISMYQIWEALTDVEGGYHPDFHMILVVSKDAPVEHMDILFRQMFAIVDEDGTFYRELEHA